ncbi:lipopolysaccharide biosynthesis protein [Pseudokineococcus sp. 5B2Z-1]|uniref:lipopolysaccharide biosynthesis protein n=1 Tax=Pseudokineococcus sp. 5B2Z-1 TaxID=3132744 RepID=UPI0030ABE5C4
MSAVTGLGDRAARGAGVTLTTQLLRAVLQLGSVVVLARLLVPEDFGLVAMVTAVIGIADLVRDFGLSSAAVQARTLEDDERTNLFWANTALGLTCTLVAAASAPLLVTLYDEPRLLPVVLALSPIFLLSGLGTQLRADLTRSLRLGWLALSDVLAQAVAVAAAVTLALLGAGLWAVVAQQLVGAAAGLVVVASAVHWRPRRYRRGVSLRRFFGYGSGLLGTQAMTYVTKNVDDVALGAVWGAGPLGLYTRAYQLLLAPLNQINAPMTRVALPVLSRLQDDDAGYAHALGRAQLVGCYVTTTVLLVVAGLADPVVDVLFGPGWAGVVPLLLVLALGGVPRALSQLAFWMYLSRGRTGAQLKQFLVTRPLLVVCVLAGLPWGALGVAVGHGVGHLLAWGISLWHAGRTTGVDVRPLVVTASRSVLLVGAPAGLAANGATWLLDAPIAQLALGLLLAAAWVAAACTLVPPVRRDARVVLTFARRAARRHA